MSEITDIVSKEAIQSIKDADSALVKFDGNIEKLISDLKLLTGSGAGFKDINKTLSDTATAAKKYNDAQKESLKVKEKISAAEKKAATDAQKLIDKEKELTAAIKLQVKSIEDAQRQNKALTESRKKLDLTTAQGRKTLQEYNATMTKNTEFIRQNATAMEKQRMNIGNYKSAFDGIGSKLAGAFSVTAVLAFGKAAFAAFEEQEQANRKLLFSLNGNKVAFRELTAQANDFQSKTGIADDAIQGIQVMAAESGKTTAEIKKITEATINWSKITGQDLQSAYLQINGTLTGTAGRLTRVDAEFKTLTEEQLKSGAAIDLINTKYKGFAENAASDTEKLSANWSEFMELMGKGVANIAVPALNSLNGLLRVTTADSLTFMEKLKAVMQGGAGIGSALAVIEGSKVAGDRKSALNSEAIRNAESTKELVKKTVAEKLAASAAITAEQNKKKSAEEAKGAITKQIGAYAKLTQSISDTKEEINNLLALGKTPSTELMTQLQQQEAQLMQVGKAAEFAALKLVAMQQGDVKGTLTAKGLSGVVSGAKAGKSRLTARDNGSGFGAPEGTEMFGEGEFSQFAVEQAQTVADATFQIIANSANAELDLKLNNLEIEKEAKLKNTKLTEAQKAKIEADYAKKEKALKTEAAKKEKAAAIIQAIIATALSIVKASPNVPMMIAAGVAGAAQTAIIAATKIPQFDAGVQSSPSTFWAGEKRPEFLRTPTGSIQYVSQPTLFSGMAGSTVISGEETDRILKAAGKDGLAQVNFMPAFNSLENKIVEAVKSQSHININVRTGRITDRKDNYSKEYFNRLFKA